MTAAAGHGHRCIQAHHLGAHHGHRFALRGIDLAGHDRAAGFIGGQAELPQPSAGAAGQQADVVGDFEQAHRQQAQLPHRMDQSVMACHHGEFVRCRAERQASDPCQFLGRLH